MSDETNQNISKGQRTGVLLINLGTPDAPTPEAVRRYLGEFLSDPLVVTLPRVFWLPLLYGIILPTRSGITALNYQRIWNSESNESPLRYFTRLQADATTNKIAGKNLIIEWAMRYGNPSISEQMKSLKQQGCTDIVTIPLYPQYSTTTTLSVNKAVEAALLELNWQPKLTSVPAFYDEPSYIDALTAVTRRQLSSLDWTPERVVISFHGLPKRTIDAGDPYLEHCTKTARLLRKAMNWDDTFAPMTFQSKFGRAKWLEPTTAESINRLGSSGVKNIAVITPGFVADCIETLEEIDITTREEFLAAGGENFSTIPCLNNDPEMISMLETIIRRETRR